MTAFSKADILQYTSVHTVGPVTSLGGAKSAVQISDGFLHALFDIVPQEQADTGRTEFRIVFITNANVDEDMLNPRVVVIQDSTSPNTTYGAGWMPSDINSPTQTLASETTSPAGVVWCRSARLQDAAILGANIPRNGGYAALALERRVLPGAQTFKEDTAKIIVSCDNLDVGVTTPTGPATPPIIDIGVIGEVEVNDNFKKILEFFKYRNMGALFTIGNNVGGSVINPAHSAFDFTALFGDILRKITWPAFGQKDRNPVVKNYLREYFGVQRTYYSKTFFNIHCVIMDTSDPNRVPYDEGSDQYEWVKKNLEDARDNPDIDWRVLFVNRGFYAATTSPAKKKYVDATLRDVYHPLLQDTYTHVAVQGTWSNFQLTHALQYNETDPTDPIPKLTDQAPNYSFQGKGFDGENASVIFVTSGSSGSPSDIITNSPAFVRYAQSIRYGGLRLRVDNLNKKLIGDFVDDRDRLLSDAHFTITKT